MRQFFRRRSRPTVTLFSNRLPHVQTAKSPKKALPLTVEEELKQARVKAGYVMRAAKKSR